MKRLSKTWATHWQSKKPRPAILVFDLLIESINRWLIQHTEKISGSIRPPMCQPWKHSWTSTATSSTCRIEPLRFGPIRQEFLGNIAIITGSCSPIAVVVPDQCGFGSECIRAKVDHIQVSLDLITFSTRTKDDIMRWLIAYAARSYQPDQPDQDLDWLATLLRWLPKVSLEIQTITVHIASIHGMSIVFADVKIASDGTIDIASDRIRVTCSFGDTLSSIADLTGISWQIAGDRSMSLEISEACVTGEIYRITAIPSFHVAPSKDSDEPNNSSASVRIVSLTIDRWHLQDLEWHRVGCVTHLFLSQISLSKDGEHLLTATPSDPSLAWFCITSGSNRIADPQEMNLDLSPKWGACVSHAIHLARFAGKITDRIVGSLPQPTSNPWIVTDLVIRFAFQSKQRYELRIAYIASGSISTKFFDDLGGRRIDLRALTIRSDCHRLDMRTMQVVSRSRRTAIKATGMDFQGACCQASCSTTIVRITHAMVPLLQIKCQGFVIHPTSLIAIVRVGCLAITNRRLATQAKPSVMKSMLTVVRRFWKLPDSWIAKVLFQDSCVQLLGFAVEIPTVWVTGEHERLS